MDKKYNLLIYENNRNIADSLLEILGEHQDFLVAIFSGHNQNEIERNKLSPDLILFNASNDRDIAFLSNIVVKLFREASVLFMIDPQREKNLVALPVFKKIHFLYKPVSVNLLLDTIRNISTEQISKNSKEIALGQAVINLEERSLRNDIGEKIYLTDKEGLLINLLFESNPNPIKKDELLQKVWGYSENVKTRTLETHIYRIRKKLNDFLRYDDLIIFENGGYKIKL